MFTGIIQSLGTVTELTDHSLTITAPGIHEEPGASVSVDGCCLTVVRTSPAADALAWPGDGHPVATSLVSFDVLPETVARTRIASLEVGSRVNLEAALRAGAALGGHWVQGHVDEVGTVRAREAAPGGEWLDLWIDLPQSVLRYCIDRGSLTVNGVSLTVMELDAAGVRLQLIPETQQRTNLGSLRVGEPCNLEADVLARYVERLLQPAAAAQGQIL